MYCTRERGYDKVVLLFNNCVNPTGFQRYEFPGRDSDEVWYGPILYSFNGNPLVLCLDINDTANLHAFPVVYLD